MLRCAQHDSSDTVCDNHPSGKFRTADSARGYQYSVFCLPSSVVKIGFVFPLQLSLIFLIFTCHKRAYVDFVYFKIGFVFSNKGRFVE